jgi:hypothetical protein
MIDIMDTLDQREEQYGDYRDVAKISQLIKMALRDVCDTGVPVICPARKP